MVILSDFFEILEKYKDLGWAVQEQLKEVAINGHDVKEANSSAMKMSVEFIQSVLHFFENSDIEELKGDLGCLEAHIEGNLE